jgi:hypothetical protein
MKEITSDRSRRFKYLTGIVFGYNNRRPEEVELVDGRDKIIVLSGRLRHIASRMRKIANWLERLSKKGVEPYYAEPYIRYFNNIKITVWSSVIELYGPSGNDDGTWEFIFIYAKPKQAASEFYKIADWLERV